MAEDTIAAIATPPGIGALGIIRVSGQDAIGKVNRLFPARDLALVRSHTLHYGPLKANGLLLDEVLLSVFRAPRTYTGEDLVEISCHGSPYILQRVMEALLAEDIRLATGGEFTQRAFMNGKMDLSQAEAVADLIASENETMHRVALEQMRGGFSQKISELRAQLLQFASLVELELDFAEEDVEFANRETFLLMLDRAYRDIHILAESFQLGNVVKAGVKVVIAGRPNAGKSTLLNQLLNEERAIVSDIPGTTRDTIEDMLTISGIQFRFIDTAGIRATADALESIGIARTLGKLQEAHLIIYLFDVNELGPADLAADLASLPPDKVILCIGNKTDRDTQNSYTQRFAGQEDILYISGKNGDGIEALKTALVRSLDLPDRRLSDPLVTNIRHYRALKSVLQNLQAIQQGIADGLPTDLLTVNIRHALHHMGEITGEVTTDEILGNIFSKFCIGK